MAFVAHAQLWLVRKGKMNSCGRCRLHIFEAVESDKASSRVCVHVTRVVGACAVSCNNMSAFE